MVAQLMEGSEALVRASLLAGCRFFAGYPMTPFTEILEHFAELMPEHGGTCINAESELEAVGMAWGAAATGARAATGSTGQGLSLMQESLSEATLAEVPLVVFNMARSQGDYFQAWDGARWRTVYLTGANIGPARPGEWSVAASLAFDTYREWLGQIAESGANTVRVYTILPPAFYQALWYHNQAAPGPLWLIQEVWLSENALDLYDPRIRPGMDADEVRALLPQVLPEVRRFVVRRNDLAP